MKLIVERDYSGALYIYKETEKHFRKVEKNRAGRRVSFRKTEEECYGANLQPGEYIVYQLDIRGTRELSKGL